MISESESLREESTASALVQPFAEWLAAVIELAGVSVIAVLVGFALLYAIVALLRGANAKAVFRELRAQLVSGILIGLELLVAADIIHTVAVELTFSSIGVLVVVVLVRTFLSFTLELELTGRWPWQQKSGEKEGAI
ncbi:DUF1622 domain-containing protein [Candidatus Laterigemmans baculatus]|uniref:DUF1622 domain-containing protein n=1 Tax=Candidatus Laterigemmans baculatus TaxID=2770505 RepID=UPI0013DCBB5A|nr:DUF1622 domain-containing protein [Candidatus Laterigemmans baculatus]